MQPSVLIFWVLFASVVALPSRAQPAATRCDEQATKKCVAVNQSLIDAINREDFIAINTAIKQGAAVNGNVKGLKPGLPPLLTAILVNEPKSVELLLRAGANPNLVQNGQYSVFDATNADSKILKLILDANANPNSINANGEAALHRAASCNRRTYVALKKRGYYKKKFPDCQLNIRLLLSAGANIELRGIHQNTPLMDAVYWNNFESVELLIASGSKVETSNAYDYTPLLIAIKNYADEQHAHRQHHQYINGHVLPTIELLLKAGANANVTFPGQYEEDRDPEEAVGNMSGNTPITFAARRGWADLVALLIKYEADPNVPRSDGLTALEIAKRHQHSNVSAVLPRIN